MNLIKQPAIMMTAVAALLLSACVVTPDYRDYGQHKHPQGERGEYRDQEHRRGDDGYDYRHDRDDDRRYRRGDDDDIEEQVRYSSDFPAVRQRAINILRARGYTRIKDIDVDTRQGRPVLEIEAYKGLQEYDIKMSYPDLRILSERRD